MNQSATEAAGVGIAQPTDEFEEEITSSETEEIIDKKKSRAKVGELRRKIKKSFAFNQGANDVLGVVFMEVQAARDLPPERNGELLLLFNLID
jgi:UDP:flavonoid glycosyltransferase YjiC (YdhE family)